MGFKHQLRNDKNRFVCEYDYCHKDFICNTESCKIWQYTFCGDCLRNYDEEEYEIVRLETIISSC